MHTNFDSAPGCMADLAARPGAWDCEPLELMGELAGEAYGIGKVGRLKRPMELESLARRVKEEKFRAAFCGGVQPRTGVPDPVSQVAVCPGAGGSEIGRALESRAQVLVTGDIGHHQGIDSVAQRMAVIDAGHYGLEHIFVDYMAAGSWRATGKRRRNFKGAARNGRQVVL